MHTPDTGPGPGIFQNEGYPAPFPAHGVLKQEGKDVFVSHVFLTNGIGKKRPAEY
jgi:hypothetical protein